MEFKSIKKLTKYLTLFNLKIKEENKEGLLNIDRIVILTTQKIDSLSKEIITLINFCLKKKLSTKISVLINNLSIKRNFDTGPLKKVSSNIGDAEYHLFKYLTNEKNILWFEDDALFHNITKKDIKFINHFTKHGNFDILRLGHASPIQTFPCKLVKSRLLPISRLYYTGGFHACIISKNGRDLLIKWKDHNMVCSDEFHLFYFLLEGFKNKSKISNLKEFKKLKQYGYYKPLATQVFKRSKSNQEWQSNFGKIIFKLIGLDNPKYAKSGFYIMQSIPFFFLSMTLINRKVMVKILMYYVLSNFMLAISMSSCVKKSKLKQIL